MMKSDLIEAAGAQLRYLPPYSPDLNPIEMAFAKLKSHLRKAAERSIPALWDRIGSILDLFSSDECLNFFHHAGYAYSQFKMVLSADRSRKITRRDVRNEIAERLLSRVSMRDTVSIERPR